MHTSENDRGLADTGVAGLDAILSGGLPRGRLYLVQGSPGAGKTTLGLQFLLEGTKRGEKGLYITLSETQSELEAVAASHGWSLDGIAVLELDPGAADLHADSQQTVFPTAEVELGETMRTLLDEVTRIDPGRVVFDSLSEIRLLAQSALRYRRQILALKHYFAGSSATVLLLDDLTSEPDVLQLQSLAHGVIELEQTAQSYRADRRRLRVTKLRGVGFHTGYHDFDIERGGLCVYPRLVASDHRPGFEAGCVSTGLAGLDALLGGGLDRGTSLLLTGPPGTGKSALASQIVAAFAARGERGAIYTFEESIDTTLARGQALGAPLARWIDDGTVSVTQVNPAELTPGRFIHGVRMAVQRSETRVVVIDSLNGYLNAMPPGNDLLGQLHELFAFLGQHGCVAVLTLAQQGLVGGVRTPVDVSYLADGVVLLRFFEVAGRIRKAISLVKRRNGPHEDTIREFGMIDGTLRVGEPLSAFRGVLTGVPTYTGSGAPLMGGQDGDGS